MRFGWIIAGSLSVSAAHACPLPMGVVDPDAVAPPQILTFEQTRSSYGTGHPVKDLLVFDAGTGYAMCYAQGQDATAFVLDNDQSALCSQICRGERDQAMATFLSRAGPEIAEVTLLPAHETAPEFVRSIGAADIAGILVPNANPQGLALDNTGFGKSPHLS